jgi:two-component system sensor histidine kinase KdpD
MALVLEVLAVAGLGDWLLAVLTSVAASLSFSYFFVEARGSFKITSWEGAITYSMMLTTALTGSHLAIRAQRRAAEAIRRREEMERLQQLGNALLGSDGVVETAENVVVQVVQLFGVSGAVLRLDGIERTFSAGHLTPGRSSCIWLDPGASKSILEFHGVQPSPEVRNALANLIKLVLDRANGAEERARIEASQRGDELRNTVLNALAHNFRTPLTSIKAAASMLCSSQGLAEGPDRELAIIIDEEADRLDLLIRESLNLARIEGRQAQPRIETCSVASIVDAVRSRVTRYLGSRRLIVEIPEDLPALRGDRFLFEQMLIQVVDNAWKYSKPDARVGITASTAGGTVIITVRNEGIEIPDEERSKIFAKFYRGTVSRSQVEGTGLGLAIAQTIAEVHGGRIWLDSEPTGPAFSFALPAVDTAEPFVPASVTGERSDS